MKRSELIDWILHCFRRCRSGCRFCCQQMPAAALNDYLTACRLTKTALALWALFESILGAVVAHSPRSGSTGALFAMAWICVHTWLTISQILGHLKSRTAARSGHPISSQEYPLE